VPFSALKDKMKAIASSLLVGSYLLGRAEAHGALVHPRSRNSIDYEQVNCDAGSDHCAANAKGTGCVNYTHPTEPCYNGQASFWYSQGCFIGCDECDHKSGRRQTDLCGSGKAATLPDYARSVNRNATRGSALDIYKHNPWSAPGSAPVADACGLAGGWPWGNDGGEAGLYVNTTNARHGQNGTTLLPTPAAAEWVIGGEAEVSWQVRNNHGGGYSYRLCPASEPLTEACFQRHPLAFQPSLSTLAFADGSRVAYRPTLVSEGTQPAGSTWARIPIAPTALGPICIPGPGDDPAAPNSCAKANNHADSEPCGCTPCPQTPGSDCSRCDNCGTPAFEPVATHGGRPVMGVGPVVGMNDVVKVPGTLPPGRYVLGWRYDCEATAQVWSNCADITLVAPTAA